MIQNNTVQYLVLMCINQVSVHVFVYVYVYLYGYGGESESERKREKERAARFFRVNAICLSIHPPIYLSVCISVHIHVKRDNSS